MKQVITTTPEETIRLAVSLGKAAKGGLRIALEGSLGAGKTTFVQGFAKGMGVPDDYYITSPTYTIINEYPAGELTLCHLDLYRLGSADELEYIGFDELLDHHHVLLIEWPGLLSEDQFFFDLEIQFTFEGDLRLLNLIPYGQSGTDLLSNVVL